MYIGLLHKLQKKPDLARQFLEKARAPAEHHGATLLVTKIVPRGTDFSRISQSYLNAIALRLNQRPRKTLGFQTPADRLQAVLH